MRQGIFTDDSTKTLHYHYNNQEIFLLWATRVVELGRTLNALAGV